MCWLDNEVFGKANLAAGGCRLQSVYNNGIFISNVVSGCAYVIFESNCLGEFSEQ